MELSPDQFSQLLTVLKSLSTAPGQYTITGAADWPMLLVLCGFFGTALTGLICFMWHDLGKRFDGYEVANEKSHEAMWKSQKDCQDDCCPRGKRDHI